jgi:integrase
MSERSKLPRGFFRRGNTIYLTTDPITGRKLSTGCTRTKDAERFRQLRLEQSLASDRAPEKTQTLEYWLGVTMQDIERRRAAKTLEMYASRGGHLLRLFGSIRVGAIRGVHVVEYVRKRRAETYYKSPAEPECRYSEPTIHKEIVVLSQVLRRAQQAGEWHGSLDEVRPIGLSGVSKPTLGVLSAEDEAVLREALSPADWAIVAISLATACRPTTILGFRPEHIDWQRGAIWVPGTKTTRSARWIPIVEGWNADYIRDAAPHLPIRRKRPSNWFGGVCKRLELSPGLALKTLRKTVATRLREQGVSGYDTIGVTGHADTGTLLRYYDQSSLDALKAEIEKRVRPKSVPGAEPETGENQAIAAERGGFEPPVGCPTPDFESAGDAHDSSVTSRETGGLRSVLRRAEAVPSGEIRPSSTQKCPTLPLAQWALVDAAARVLRGAA